MKHAKLIAKSIRKVTDGPIVTMRMTQINSTVMVKTFKESRNFVTGLLREDFFL